MGTYNIYYSNGTSHSWPSEYDMEGPPDRIGRHYPLFYHRLTSGKCIFYIS